MRAPAARARASRAARRRRRRAARPSTSARRPPTSTPAGPASSSSSTRSGRTSWPRTTERRHCYDCDLPRRAGADALVLIVPTLAGSDPADGRLGGQLPVRHRADELLERRERARCSSSRRACRPTAAASCSSPTAPRRPSSRCGSRSHDPPPRRGRRRRARAALAAPARADDEALVRVIAEEASVRTGPGFGYRVVYRANQGEVLTAIGRATHDHWFRVELPDGTYGWILGDEVFPLDVDMAAAHRGPVDLEADGGRHVLAVAADAENVTFTFSAGRAGRRRHVPVPARGAAGAARRAGGVRRRDGRQPGRRHLRGRRLQRLPVPDARP